MIYEFLYFQYLKFNINFNLISGNKSEETNNTNKLF